MIKIWKLRLRNVLIVLFTMSLLLACLTETKCQNRSLPQLQSTGQKVNIIFILADDLGYGDLGIYGGKAKTPNLDRLAQEGIRFTDFHSNGANCSPTRAALLTGRYQQRMGIEGALGKGDPGLGSPEAKDEITIAQYLQKAGYRTGIMGKWHLGYNPEQSPVHFGFDEFYGMLHGAVDYHSHVNTFGRYDWWHNDKLIKEEGYATELITNHSLDFIESSQAEPFFLFVSHLAIHFPWQTPDDEPHREEGKAYRAVSGPLNRLGPHSPDETGKVVRIMIEEMDKSVGRIIMKIKELNLDRHTLVFFMSDNGGITDYRGGYNEISSNKPLRGAKHQLYEGGHRVPAMAWMPGIIEAGRVTSQTTMTMDMLPTILEITGYDDLENKLDGIDLSPVLFEGKSLSSRALFWKSGNAMSARLGDYKLIVYENGTSELYNLQKDIAETNNIANANPKKVDELSIKLDEWQKEVYR